MCTLKKLKNLAAFHVKKGQLAECKRILFHIKVLSAFYRKYYVIFSVKSAQNLRIFWCTTPNLFILALLPSLYSFKCFACMHGGWETYRKIKFSHNYECWHDAKMFSFRRTTSNLYIYQLLDESEQNIMIFIIGELPVTGSETLTNHNILRLPSSIIDLLFTK